MFPLCIKECHDVWEQSFGVASAAQVVKQTPFQSLNSKCSRGCRPRPMKE